MQIDHTDRLRIIEERYSHLERHVADQDRAMLAMAERIDRLETRLRQLVDRVIQRDEPGLPADERPPHY